MHVIPRATRGALPPARIALAVPLPTLLRNSQDSMACFQLPANGVMELGGQAEI